MAHKIISFNYNTKKYLALVTSLFNKYDLAIDATTNYNIPIVLASASRLYKALASKTTKVTSRVPIMSIEFTEFIPSEQRSINRMNNRSVVQLPDGENIRVHKGGVATDFLFNMTIVTKNLVELSNISEAIVSDFHNNIRYVDYKTLFGDIVSTPVRLEKVNNDTDMQSDQFTSLGYYAMTFNLLVEGFIETNKPHDSKKIKQIDLLIQHEHDNIVELLERYVVLPLV